LDSHDTTKPTIRNGISPDQPQTLPVGLCLYITADGLLKLSIPLMPMRKRKRKRKRKAQSLSPIPLSDPPALPRDLL
jgi:hypothetical protein